MTRSQTRRLLLIPLLGILLTLTNLLPDAGAATSNSSKPESTSPVPIQEDEFQSATLSDHWYWIREVPSHWSISSPAEVLNIVTEPKDIWQHNATAPLLLQNIDGPLPNHLAISTKVVLAPTENYHQGGLIFYEDDDNYIRLMFGHFDGKGVQLGLEEEQLFSPITTQVSSTSTDIHLRIVRLLSSYVGQYSYDGQVWFEVGRWDNTNFTPVAVGLTAFSSITDLEIPAAFDYFHYREYTPIFLPTIVNP